MVILLGIYDRRSSFINPTDEVLVEEKVRVEWGVFSHSEPIKTDNIKNLNYKAVLISKGL